MTNNPQNVAVLVIVSVFMGWVVVAATYLIVTYLSNRASDERCSCLSNKTLWVRPTRKERKMSWLREYVDEHRGTLFTAALLLLADHCLFDGKLKNKAEEMIVSLCDKTKDKAAQTNAEKESGNNENN